MDFVNLDATTCLEDWRELTTEFENLEVLHKNYLAQVDKMVQLQNKCLSGINHQKYRMRTLASNLQRLTGQSKDTEESKKLNTVSKEMTSRKYVFREMEEFLPHKNGVYLSIILGQVNVSLLNKQDRFAYKQDYERFKLVLCVITLFLSFALHFVHVRAMDALFHFLLVWYYCTLTIREHILMVNGSRIKGWWVAHHFLSTFLSGVMLTWPDSFTYWQFRDTFMHFSLYLSIVQIMQYYYQTGQLYRLRSLGERHSMDVTIEGFHSWMWRGLTFLLPFLIGAYIFELYNAVQLWGLRLHPQCFEWQVNVLAVTFFSLFVGNMYTTLAVMLRKITQTPIKDINLGRFYKSKYLPQQRLLAETIRHLFTGGDSSHASAPDDAKTD